jgi:DNA-binding response OmpR family regulator
MYLTSRTGVPVRREAHESPTIGNLGRRVLVVEDDPDIRALVVEYLLAAGFDVGQARNGEIAMQMIRERAPDVVCLDLNLPRISGYDVCEQIRADVAIKDISILITSARNSLDVRVFSLEAGADAYLTKPFGLDELTDEIERLFEIRMLNQRETSTSATSPAAYVD